MGSTVMDRLRAGEDVTAEDLVREDAERRLAALRAEAERAGEAAEQERRRRVEAIRADLPRRLDRGRLDKERARLAAAIDRWVGVCADRDRALADTLAELGQLGTLPADLVPNGHGSGSLVDVAGRETYRRSPAQRAIAEEATAAIRKHFPRTASALDPVRVPD